MMDTEKLTDVLEKHQKWMSDNGGERADLQYADLQYADLQSADLQSADLQSADLRYADLRYADLQSADLQSANLQSADLQSADLQSADLRSANLRSADLRSADLQYANLQYADLQGAKNIPSQYCTSLSILKSQKGLITAFKYLDKGMISPYQNHEYKIGETYETDKYDTDERVLCGEGYNVATLEWCLRDTDCDLDRIYIEVEFMASDIVTIPYNSDGKFRVRKLTVVRKLTEKELKAAIKPLYPSTLVTKGE